MLCAAHVIECVQVSEGSAQLAPSLRHFGCVILRMASSVYMVSIVYMVSSVSIVHMVSSVYMQEVEQQHCTVQNAHFVCSGASC